MSKAFKQIRKYWKTNLITFVIALVIGVLFVGLLMWVSHLGAFDTIVFGFKQLTSSIFAKDPRRDGNLVDYKAMKAEKRSDASYNFVTMIFAGLLMLIAVLVLEIIYHNSLPA